MKLNTHTHTYIHMNQDKRKLRPGEVLDDKKVTKIIIHSMLNILKKWRLFLIDILINLLNKMTSNYEKKNGIS